MHIIFEEAVRLLKEGKVVAVPTETVYGLAASLSQPAAIDRIFALKKRPLSNPLIIHLSKVEQLSPFVTHIPKEVREMAAAFWPGPMTLVLPIALFTIPNRVCAGLPTAAFRIPGHPMTLSLMDRSGPLVMPSANLSGRPSATCSAHVEEDFGNDFPVLDGGPCSHGLESTILHRSNDRWQIVRLGALPAAAFSEVLGYTPDVVSHEKEKSPICPGQLFRHYAPRARLKLTSAAASCRGVVIGFSDRSYPEAAQVFTLGSLLSPQKVAENLYHTLRQLDLEGIEEAYVDMLFPDHGLWNTIAERLTKASAK